MGRALVLRWLLALVACASFAPRIAAGQTAESAGIPPAPPDLGALRREIAVVIAVLSLVPAGVGVDLAVGPHSATGARLLFDWPVQIPLPLRGARSRTAPFATHRLVVTPGLAVPFDSPGRVVVRARVGYRAVFHPRGAALGLALGVGHTIEPWPEVRASVSPEFGVRVGQCCEPTLVDAAILVRADAWIGGSEAARVSVQLGWSFY